MSTFCSYYNQNLCRSCDLLPIDYAAQIKHKEASLKALLHLKEILPSVTSAQEHFRNKAKFTVTGTIENPLIGIAGVGGHIDVGTDLSNCPLHLEEINNLIPQIKNLIRVANLVPYSIAEKKGELKGLILFSSPETREMYLRFVLRSKEAIDRIKKHLPPLLTLHPELKCVTANIQPVPHAILEGEEELFLAGEKHIHHVAGKVVLKLHPRAFVQTNQAVAKKLYETAATWVREAQIEKFSELFCGQGAFSFFCAPYIQAGLGVEINALAVETANITARENNLTHLRFEAADAAQVERLLRDFRPDLILVNPPRRGLGDGTRLLKSLRPEKIIYSSCDTKTLAQDLKELSDYRIVRAQLFDMFPHTSHFETLVELSTVD